MRFIYVFYPDVFIFHEVLMNLSISIFSTRMIKLPISTARVVLGACLGSIIPLPFLLISYNGYILGNYLIGIPLMSYIIVSDVSNSLTGRLKRGMLLSVTLFGMSALIGGITQASINSIGSNGYVEIYIILAFIIAGIFMGVFQENGRRKRNIHRVILENEGRKYAGYGLYDSGNLLRDRVSGDIVHIVDEKILDELNIKECIGAAQYKSLGNTQGEISLYRMEIMNVIVGKSRMTFTDCLVGKAQADLLAKKDYKIVLNEGIGNEIGNKTV